MAYPNVTMKISPPVYRRVTAIKEAMEAAEERQVSYSEALDNLVERWDATGGLITQVTDPKKPVIELHMQGVIERGAREAGR